MRPVSSILSQLSLESRAARRRRRLQAFRPPFRRLIAGLTADCPALEDLADSFPALLFALATGYGTAAARDDSARLIARGGRLKEASATLGLPLWLRRLPTRALLHRLAPLPVDGEFGKTMTAHMPDTERECALWFTRANVALELAGREFALWVAREPRLLPPLTSEEDIKWLMAWVWASRHPGWDGHRLLRQSWCPTMGWKKARDEIAVWKKRVDLVGALAGEPRDPWFENAQVQDFEIIHLDSVDAFIDESVAMDNCLDQYATHLAYGRVRVFSVRRDGKPVADVELTQRPDEMTMPCVSQIRGLRNRRAPPAIWQAVHAWLGAQPFRTIIAAPTPVSAKREALTRFWQAYAEALTEAGISQRLGPPMTREPRRTFSRNEPTAEATAQPGRPTRPLGERRPPRRSLDRL